MLGPSVQAISILSRGCAKQRTQVEAEASFNAAQGHVSRTGIPWQILLRVDMGIIPRRYQNRSRQPVCRPRTCAAWCTAGHGHGFPRILGYLGTCALAQRTDDGKGGYSRHRPGPFRHCPYTLSRISCCRRKKAACHAKRTRPETGENGHIATLIRPSDHGSEPPIPLRKWNGLGSRCVGRVGEL